MFDIRARKNGRPLLVGHRGAMDVAPENTLPALAAGLAGGADILEVDVQLTADGEVVLFHDTNLYAKTSVQGRVSDYTADYLCRLDVGRSFSEQFAGITIPRLSEALNWARGRVPLMLELKYEPPDFAAGLELAVVNLVQDFGMVDEAIIIGFDQFGLRRVKQLNPDLATSFIYVGRFLNPLALIDGLDVDILSPSTNFLTAEEVKLIQDAGYPCSPGGFYWDYPTLLDWGVDTISSNDPASFQYPTSKET